MEVPGVNCPHLFVGVLTPRERTGLPSVYSIKTAWPQTCGINMPRVWMSNTGYAMYLYGNTAISVPAQDSVRRLDKTTR
jgi:hypothetical protein